MCLIVPVTFATTHRNFYGTFYAAAICVLLLEALFISLILRSQDASFLSVTTNRIHSCNYT